MFLDKLPTEIRIQIYEHLLRFDEPIKLRQIIPGSKNLRILRTNRQIHDEALPVLYDINRVVVTRNDFCRNTDPGLKTPLKLEHARHLLVTSFSQSIACTLIGPPRQCDVCQPDALGLIWQFTRMPRLQTVVVDYHNHLREMSGFKAGVGIYDGLELCPWPELAKDEAGSDKSPSSGKVTQQRRAPGTRPYKLAGAGLGGLDIRFECGRLEGR